jgi:uncharacterized protein YbjT (DUF2867 family)
MIKILIAGASGFIGKALIDELLKNENYHVIAISRRDKVSEHPRLTWKKADLFSLKDIREVIEGCDEAFYLVHSMLPSAALSQGTFYDFDLIMADNFIRAANIHKLKHITYLGGMIPVDRELTWHLRSRLEVEKTLQSSKIPVTVLRAGLIIGAQGSSFTIVERLIKRLPIMICPSWTRTRSQPIALKDVISALLHSIQYEEVRNGVYDLGGPEIVTYQDLIFRAANKINKKRKLVSLNIIPLSLSRLWVSLITGVPRDLVYPLVLSLKHEMLASSSQLWPYRKDLSTSLDVALKEALQTPSQVHYAGHRTIQKDVRSIQRLVLPPGRNADWIAQEYFRWLPQFFSSLIRVGIDGNRCTFYLFHPNLKLLILEKSSERSSPDRQLLYIVGGLLSAQQERGRLEFREVLNRQYVMAAIHEFRPSLPWFIYRWTQAIIHLFVMRAFGEHLKWHVISQQRKSL